MTYREPCDFDHGKDMSMHVSTYTMYACINSNCVGLEVLIRHVFLHLIKKMSDGFLEQQINIKFYMKLGKNASDTCAMLCEA